MDPSIWSRLPFELLLLVIASSSDAGSLASWCEATAENGRAHQIALKQRWRSVKIDEWGLIPKPGDDYHDFQQKERIMRRHKVGLSWKAVGEETLELTRPLGNGLLPASYVEDILFDFRMLRFGGGDFAELDRYKLIPSAESLDHTLSILKPTLVNVRRIEAFGSVPEALLSLVVDVTPLRIQSLRIRTRRGLGDFRYQGSPSGPSAKLSLSLDTLSKLSQLQDLDIHELSRDEAPRLATAIPKLTQLLRLVIADKENEHSEPNKVIGPCPMECFIDNLLATKHLQDCDSGLNNDRPGNLPSTLTSLTLIDNNTGPWYDIY